MKFSRQLSSTVILLIVAITVFSILIFVPLSAEAAGLVPCGGPGEPECDLCQLAKLSQNIIEFAVRITFILAALLFAYAGFLFFTGGSDPGQISRAKKIFTNTFVGLVIVLVSWLVVDILLKTLTGQGATPFTQILCEAPGTLRTGVEAGTPQTINPSQLNISNQSFSEQCSNVKGAGWITVTDSFCIQPPEGDTRTYEWTTFSSGAQLCCALPAPSGDTTLSSSVFDITNTEGIQDFNSQCAAQGGYSTNLCVSEGSEGCERAKFECIRP